MVKPHARKIKPDNLKSTVQRERESEGSPRSVSTSAWPMYVSWTRFTVESEETWGNLEKIFFLHSVILCRVALACCFRGLGTLRSVSNVTRTVTRTYHIRYHRLPLIAQSQLSSTVGWSHEWLERLEWLAACGSSSSHLAGLGRCSGFTKGGLWNPLNFWTKSLNRFEILFNDFNAGLKAHVCGTVQTHSSNTRPVLENGQCICQAAIISSYQHKHTCMLSTRWQRRSLCYWYRNRKELFR